MSYVGNSADKARILKQEKERDEQRRTYEDARNKTAAGLRQFGAGTSEMLENAFKNETVGLVTRDEFVEKRQTLADRLEADAKRQREAEAEAEWRERERQRAKRVKAEQKHKLSFDDDDGEAEDEDLDQAPNPKAAAAAAAPSAVAAASADAKAGGAAPARRFATLGKDPSVRSDFLPDRDREREEGEMREELKREWALRQAAAKAEPLDITYSFWNGAGHRRHVTVRKGDTVAAFLKAVQEQLAPQFREIRNCGVSGLMYVKEDIILPQTMTFYDLIASRAQGKSGPLFQFDLQQTAVAAFDPRLKAQDSHAGKVLERHWYNRHKHIFPYSRYEAFDPEKHTPAGIEAAAAAASGDDA